MLLKISIVRWNAINRGSIHPVSNRSRINGRFRLCKATTHQQNLSTSRTEPHDDKLILNHASYHAHQSVLGYAIFGCLALVFASLYAWYNGRKQSMNRSPNTAEAQRAVSPARSWAEKNFDFKESAEIETIARLLICTRRGQVTSFLSGEGRSGDFISTLVARYSAIPHSSHCTGIKIDYPQIGASLVYLEGEASNICALSREINGDQQEQHGLDPQDTRVIVYEPESSSRFFSSFYEAKVTNERNGGSSSSQVPPQDQPLSLEERLIESAEALDLFVRLLSSKIEGISEEEDKRDALADMVGSLAISPPSSHMVMDLARNESLPPLGDFVSEFDVEFLRYKAIVAEGDPDMSLPEVQRLFSLYDVHVKRERRIMDENLKPKDASELLGHLSQFYPKKPKPTPSF
jgi:hypothetical protein